MIHATNQNEEKFLLLFSIIFCIAKLCNSLDLLKSFMSNVKSNIFVPYTTIKNIPNSNLIYTNLRITLYSFNPCNQITDYNFNNVSRNLKFLKNKQKEIKFLYFTDFS